MSNYRTDPALNIGLDASQPLALAIYTFVADYYLKNGKLTNIDDSAKLAVLTLIGASLGYGVISSVENTRNDHLLFPNYYITLPLMTAVTQLGSSSSFRIYPAGAYTSQPSYPSTLKDSAQDKFLFLFSALGFCGGLKKLIENS